MLITLGVISFSNIFILTPIAYIVICRSLDKQFKLKHYFMEKDMWFISSGVRTASYAMGILLEPYRDKKLNSKFIADIVRRRFIYQDKTWGPGVRFRDKATKLQIILSGIFWIGVLVFFCFLVLVVVHDFIIYPEVGQARLNENY